MRVSGLAVQVLIRSRIHAGEVHLDIDCTQYERLSECGVRDAPTDILATPAHVHAQTRTKPTHQVHLCSSLAHAHITHAHAPPTHAYARTHMLHTQRTNTHRCTRSTPAHPRNTHATHTNTHPLTHTHPPRPSIHLPNARTPGLAHSPTHVHTDWQNVYTSHAHTKLVTAIVGGSLAPVSGLS